MEIRSIIVDDNPFNIEVLADLLHESEYQIKVIGVANNGMEAVKRIQELKPDLVFLDVEMPGMNGFDVLAMLDSIDFQTIFVTAHSQYAIKAIRFNALDYLMKPVVPKELSSALKRFVQNTGTYFNQQSVKTALDNLKTKKPEDQIFFLPTQEGGMRLILKNIVRIEGERNYSYIYLSNGTKKLSSKTLGYFEEILSDKGFLRCHRSHLVNGIHINIIPKNDDELSIGDATVPISRRKKSEVKKWLQVINGNK